MTVKVSKPAINVREELADLRKPSGVAGEAMLRAETPQEQFNLIGAGRRNLIINGNFQVSQRGDYSGATSLTSTATYLVDRWKFLDNSVSGTATHSTRMMRLDANSSGTGQVRAEQYVETQNIIPNQTYTLSAYVKSNKAGAGIAVFDDATSSAGDTDVYTAVHSGSSGWERLSVSLTTRDTEPYAFAIRFALTPAGNGAITSGDYLEIKEVQLELGKVATPFEHRSYGEELALCQRFYETGTHNSRGYAQDTGSGYCQRNMPDVFKVTKRANPTVSISGVASLGSDVDLDRVTFSTWTANVGNAFTVHDYTWTADAEL